MPLEVAHWSHCCNIYMYTRDDVRWSAMPLEAQNRRKISSHRVAGPIGIEGKGMGEGEGRTSVV